MKNMIFLGLEPLPEGMPVVEVMTTIGAVDLHNDFLVTAIFIDATESCVRISFERTERDATVGRKRPQSLSSLTLALTGVHDLHLSGSLGLGAEAFGLDFLRYVAHPSEGPMMEMRFDSQSALVVRCQFCSLEDSSARLRALPERGGELNR